MSLWTPYLEEPMDLTKHKPTAQVGAQGDDWHFLRETSTREDRAEYSYRETTTPGSYRETSSPGSYSLEQGPEEDPEYQQFERDALTAMSSGGRLLQNNPRMRRDIQCAQSDDQYRRQRQRNNAAAKMSRDRRKMREVRLGIQVAYLTKKLLELQARLAECAYEPPYAMYK